MELPFSINGIIFVILLIVPGVVLKRFYFQGEFTKEFGVGIFADRIISSIFLGIIIQTLSFLLLGKFYGFTYESIKDPVTQLYKAISSENFATITSLHLWMALGYMCTSLIVAASLGAAAHNIVRFLRWDVKYRLLRFNNNWNYFFRGDITHSKKFKAINRGKVMHTYIDIIMDVDHDKKKKLVTGFLADYSLSAKTGELETIYLTETKIFKSKTTGFEPISGDCYIIPYNKVIDMNLRYIYKEVQTSRFKLVFMHLFNLVGVVAFIYVLIFPWYLDVKWYLKIFALVFALIDYLLWIVVISSFLVPEAKQSLKGKIRVYALIYAVTLLFFVYFITLSLDLEYILNAICNLIPGGKS